MSRHAHPWLISLTAGAAFVLGACGAAPASSVPPATQPGSSAGTQSTVTTPGASALTHVSMVSHTLNPPTISNIYYFVARDEGIFARNGLDVEFENANNGATDFALMNNNSVQFSSTSFDNIISGNAAGNSTKLVAVGNWSFPGMIVAKDKIKTASDLQGGIIGLTTPGNFIEFVQEAYVAKNGVDAKSIQWVATGSMANITQYLISGKIDAGWIPVDEATRALEHPGLHILADPEELNRVFAVSGGVVQVSDSYARSQPDLVREFVKSSIEANRAMYEDETVFARVAEKELPSTFSADELQKIWDGYRPYFGVNGGFVDSALTRMLDQWKEQSPKDASKVSNIEQVIDRQFAKQALDQLGVIPSTTDPATWYQR